MIPDISQIGEFVYSWDFDEEDYKEYIKDNELEENKETFLEYVRDNVSFEVNFLDNETFHQFESEIMSLDDISENFGDKLANIILSDCFKNGEGSYETCFLFDDEDFDVNNKEQLNDMAKKLLQHGEYYKDCRGFILSDGTVIYTPNEHNQVTIIKGVKSKFHFIRLGNVRLLKKGIYVGQKPTPEQINVLRQVISSYSDDSFYLDIINDNEREVSAIYRYPNWRYVVGEINRYYDEGIKPMGKEVYEAKKKRTFIITEDEEQSLIGKILTEVFYPTTEKVLLVTKFLDKNFARQMLDSLDDNGYPTKENTVVWLSKEKQPLKTLKTLTKSIGDDELLRILDDQPKIRKMISNETDRKKFLRQVIKNWFYRDEGIKNGMLTVNYL